VRDIAVIRGLEYSEYTCTTCTRSTLVLVPAANPNYYATNFNEHWFKPLLTVSLLKQNKQWCRLVDKYKSTQVDSSPRKIIVPRLDHVAASRVKYICIEPVPVPAVAVPGLDKFFQQIKIKSYSEVAAE